MRAGTRKHRVTIQRPTEGAADALAEKAVAWVNVITVSASVLPQSGREFYRGSQTIAELTHVVSIRYRSGIDETMRLQLGARYLKIVSAQNVDEADEELLLFCVEQK
jgi:SPP1 family predicted phage head-tail adaptor